jgi:hypothetical protein
MNESEASLLLIMAMLIPLLFYILSLAKENGERYNEKQSEKIERRYDRAFERIKKAFNIDENESLNEDCIFYQIYSDVVNQHNAVINQDKEAAASILIDFLDSNKRFKNLLTARHPTQLAMNVPNILESSGPKLIKSENLFKKREPYLVDTKLRTCTCQEFVSYGSIYPSDDIRRVCRHQIRLMEQENTLPKLSKYVSIIASHGFRDNFYSEIQGKKSKYLIGYCCPLEWVSVWVLDSSKSQERFSFNMIEKRWSYSESPKGFAADIRTLLVGAFGLK